MEISNNSWLARWGHLSKWLPVVFLVLSLIGFLDATYLTVEHYRGTIPPCTTTGGCEKVLTSRYSTMLGVPVALGGALYYLSLLVLTGWFLDTKNLRALRLATLLTPIGFLASIYFFSLQAFVIHSWCPYCLTSAATSTLLLIVSVLFRKHSSPKWGGN